MRVIESRNIPVEKDPDTDRKAAKVMTRKEMLAGMKYAKVMQPSGRIDIMEPYVPEGTPPVVDEDLPEPTNESDGEDVTADVTANEILSKEEQAYMDNIDKIQLRVDLHSRYTSRVPLDLQQLEIDNFKVLGQFPRGTPLEPMADPGEAEEVEQSWSHSILHAVRNLPESEWTITSTAEPSSTTSSGEASTSTDSGHVDSDVRASSSRKEMASSSRKEIRQNTEAIGSLHN